MNLGPLDEACRVLEACAQQAIQAGQSAVGLSALCNLGNTELIQRKRFQAQATFQKAVEIGTKPPVNSPVVGMALMGLAEPALFGVLERIRDLSLKLVEVRQMAEPDRPLS